MVSPFTTPAAFGSVWAAETAATARIANTIGRQRLFTGSSLTAPSRSQFTPCFLFACPGSESTGVTGRFEARKMRALICAPPPARCRRIGRPAFGSLAYAQRIFVGGGRGSSSRPRFATEADFDGSFIYCRGFYRSVRGEPSGSGWGTDYPGADNNFSIRLAELTRVPVKWDPDRQPVHVVVRLDDPLLYRCPMLFMEDVGTIGFSEAEVVNLRNYLLKGGFLWVDDFWGTPAWTWWVREFSRVLPPGEYPIVDIPISHPIMHSVYDVKDFLQVSNINFWRRSGGADVRTRP